MLYPETFLYTESHEWVSFTEDGDAYVGITDYAQKELGDLVFVNLPGEGDSVVLGDAFGDVESVKAVSEIFSPLTGVVAAVNEALLDAPQQINEAPFKAWLIRVTEVTERETFLSEQQYHALISGRE